jgi:hypothetical protein
MSGGKRKYERKRRLIEGVREVMKAKPSGAWTSFK